jgi:hypothetical protein
MNGVIDKMKNACKKFLDEVMNIEDLVLTEEERNEVCHHIDEVLIHGEIAKEVITS